MGDIRGFGNKRFNTILKMLSGESVKVQMRDNAIEAARQYIHKELEEALAGQYYFAVKVFPHHVLRENKMITGAGADRMQTGMAHSFGVTVGRAAIVRPGSEIFVIAVNSDKAMKIARISMEKIKAKLPCSTRILTEKI
jgi:large subunit ribosomal protein L10e